MGMHAHPSHLLFAFARPSIRHLRGRCGWVACSTVNLERFSSKESPKAMGTSEQQTMSAAPGCAHPQTAGWQGRKHGQQVAPLMAPGWCLGASLGMPWWPKSLLGGVGQTWRGIILGDDELTWRGGGRTCKTIILNCVPSPSYFFLRTKMAQQSTQTSSHLVLRSYRSLHIL